MIKNLVKWISALALSLAAVAVIAMPGFGGMGHHDPSRMLEHLSRRLDLNEQQQAQVDELLQSVRSATAADREQMEQLHEQMRALTDDFDAGTAQSTADEIGRVTARLVYSHANTMAEIRALLTEEQLQKLEELRQRRAEHAETLREFGGRHGRGH